MALISSKKTVKRKNFNFDNYFNQKQYEYIRKQFSNKKVDVGLDTVKLNLLLGENPNDEARALKIFSESIGAEFYIVKQFKGTDVMFTKTPKVITWLKAKFGDNYFERFYFNNEAYIIIHDECWYVFNSYKNSSGIYIEIYGLKQQFKPEKAKKKKEFLLAIMNSFSGKVVGFDLAIDNTTSRAQALIDNAFVIVRNIPHRKPYAYVYKNVANKDIETVYFQKEKTKGGKRTKGKYHIVFYDRIAKAKKLGEYRDGIVDNLFRLEIRFNKYTYEYEEVLEASDGVITETEKVFNDIINEALVELGLIV